MVWSLDTEVASTERESLFSIILISKGASLAFFHSRLGLFRCRIQFVLSDSPKVSLSFWELMMLIFFLILEPLSGREYVD